MIDDIEYIHHLSIAKNDRMWCVTRDMIWHTYSFHIWKQGFPEQKQYTFQSVICHNKFVANRVAHELVMANHWLESWEISDYRQQIKHWSISKQAPLLSNRISVIHGSRIN